MSLPSTSACASSNDEGDVGDGTGGVSGVNGVNGVGGPSVDGQASGDDCSSGDHRVSSGCVHGDGGASRTAGSNGLRGTVHGAGVCGHGDDERGGDGPKVTLQARTASENLHSDDITHTQRSKYVLVVAGPCGVGKGTLLGILKKRFPDKFGYSVSHTTRKPRPGEVDGDHYHFLSKDEMERKIDAGDFIEYVTNFGEYYGTSFAAVENIRSTGKIVILEVELGGVKQIQKNRDLSESSYFLFVSPPSVDTLRQRMQRRGTESVEKIEERLNLARQELRVVDNQEGLKFDKVLVNNDVENSTSQLMQLVTEWFP